MLERSPSPWRSDPVPFEARPAGGVAELAAPGAVVLSLFVYWLVLHVLSGVSVIDYLGAASPFLGSAFCLAVGLAVAYLVASQFCPNLRQDWKVRALWLLTATLVIGHTFSSYGMFKQVLLPNRGFLWDAIFAHVGRTLLGGTSPWVITHAVFGSVGGSRLLNSLYSSWLVIIFIYPAVVALFESDRRLRFQMIASWLGAWILIGTLAAWYLASAGPIFYNALIAPDQDYQLLELRLSAIEARATSNGIALQTIQFQPMLLELYHRRVFDTVGGISAMPSMHVALATLLALTGFTKGRLLGMTLSSYAFLIWVGSVHFGWHYLIDGPVAALMMIVIWRTMGIAYQQLERWSMPAPQPDPIGSIATAPLGGIA